MKKQTVVAALSALLLLTSCTLSTDPHWAIPEHDLVIAFPEIGSFYMYQDEFTLDALAKDYLEDEDYHANNSVIDGKIYFGAAKFVFEQPSENIERQLKYSLFSVELDGTGLTELYHKEYTQAHYVLDTTVEMYGVFNDRLIFRQFDYINILDMTHKKTVFQSQSVEPDFPDEGIYYSDYTYLGQDQMVRLADEGAYVLKWNEPLGIYREILHPDSSFSNYDFLDFIEGVILFEKSLHFGDEDGGGPDLKGVRYDDGTWLEETACQALLDAKALEESPELYAVISNDIGPVHIDYQLTRKEDSLTRLLDESYLIGLYPKLKRLYDRKDFVLREIHQESEKLYLSFSYYRKLLMAGYSYRSRLVFTYDIDLETMTYLGYFWPNSDYPIRILEK